MLILSIAFFVRPDAGAGFFAALPAAAAADSESLIHEGVALRRAGDDLSALKRFQQAYELSKTPRALGQIGLAEQALGRWAAADRHLREALESGTDPWIRKNRAAVEEALSVVATHVGHLDVLGTPAGAEVRVDGELVGVLPLARPMTVTAGGVAVDVRAPEYLPIVRAAKIDARSLTRETFNLQPLSPVADRGGVSAQGSARSARSATQSTVPQPDAGRSSSAAPNSARKVALTEIPAGPDTLDSSGASATGTRDGSDVTTRSTEGGSGRRAIALVAGGLSVVSLALAIVEHRSWQQKVDTFGSMVGVCGATFPDRGGPGCKELFDSGENARLMAFVGYGLAGALAATAITLYVTEPDRRSAPRPVACAVIPATTPGIGCAFRF